MQEITTETFDEVIENNTLVLVDFWAPWCGPCRLMAPVLESISQERDDVTVVKVNADENPELVKKYDISSIPTLLLFNEGSIIKYAVGAKPKAQILEMLP